MRNLFAAVARSARHWAVGLGCGVACITPAMAQLQQPVALMGPDAMGGPGSYVNVHGEPIVVQAGYCGPGGCPPGGCGPMGCHPGMGGGMGSGMAGPGLYGAPPNSAFGAMAANVEQCGPHYFDFSAEYLSYRRDDTSFSDGVYSTLAVQQDNQIDPSQIALRGSDVDADDLHGYRLTGRFDVGALSVFEIAYSGIYSEDSGASVVQSGGTQLMSVYSLYGTAVNGPVGGQSPPQALPSVFDETTFTGPQFAATANADRHSLEFESELHTAEASFRRYWVGFNPRVSGTILLGFRYTSLEEALTFSAFRADGPNGDTPLTRGPQFLSVGGEAENQLAGFQFGGDVWVTVLQGLRFGGEAKVGIYNNDYNVSTAVSSTSPLGNSPNSSTTLLDGDQVAFLTEAKLQVVADLTPSWSLKAGYEVLFISDLALMGDAAALAAPYGNENGIGTSAGTITPAGLTPTQAPTTDGEALYHGWTIGAEYVY